MTGIYIRVSTNRQDHASQLPELTKWADAQGNSVEWYKDKFTGQTLKRPGAEKLLDAMRAGKLDQIVVWRLDRLGRTARGLCELFEELQARKVDLVSLRDGFSLNTPSGRLHARILASVAEFENEVRAERIRAGIAAAKAKGRRWGGSKRGWHYRVTPEKVATIERLFRGGEPIARIARIVSLSRATVYRVMHDRGFSFPRAE